MIVTSKSIRRFLGKICAGEKSVKYWVNTDEDRALPKLRLATVENCPISSHKPRLPFSYRVSIWLENNIEIRFEKEGTNPTLYGTSDDTLGKFVNIYPTMGLAAAEHFNSAFWALGIKPTWKDLISIDMVGTPLYATEQNGFHKIPDEDLFHPDWFDLLQKKDESDA